jgi:hypothetical protein
LTFAAPRHSFAAGGAGIRQYLVQNIRSPLFASIRARSRTPDKMLALRLRFDNHFSVHVRHRSL